MAASHQRALSRHPRTLLFKLYAGKVHKRNTLEQLKLVGPNTLSVALLTAAFVGMVFTIQVRLTPCMLNPDLFKCKAAIL